MTVEAAFTNPPGGKLVCENDQTAIIRIDNGQITASCVSAPPGTRVRNGEDYTLEFKNWILGTLMEKDRSPSQFLSYDDEEILRAKVVEYVNRNRRLVRVEFSPPAVNTGRLGGGQTTAQ